ncbi:DUF3089 domain-containing protein [Henriciella aquimarina]|uniref:DUF3089 domain-containing protein n=1 Tax=Henriciella aquimarina TaxID=545261 RepID=UPI000A01156E|nr:DUF3089 domain-containing protein [Henriciella aquimarina]
MRTLSIAALGAALFIGACGESRDLGEETPVPEAPAETQPDETGEAPAEEAAATPADYSDMANWLCHPGKSEDACSGDRDYTRVQADGTLEVERFEAAENPQIDCFYVYPTISMDMTPNSDLTPGPEEKRVTALQFSSFAETCRLFAPVYRQVTLPHLQTIMRGGEYKADEDLAFDDVKAAWHQYLDTGNDGRGVVLIGHSQGARMVERLLREDISGSAAEDLIVSAMPLGFTIYGDDESGAVGPFELCTTQGQTGCVISYVSFRSDFPPPAESRFGVSDEDGRRALCVNPAELSGDDGALDARLSKAGFFGLENVSFVDDETIETPYAALPGMLSGECVEGDNHTWLSVDVAGDPSDPRTEDIAGDVVAGGEILRDWGLHLIDVNVAMGNLLDIVAAQAETWTAREAANETGD